MGAGGYGEGDPQYTPTNQPTNQIYSRLLFNSSTISYFFELSELVPNNEMFKWYKMHQNVLSTLMKTEATQAKRTIDEIGVAGCCLLQKLVGVSGWV